MPSRLIHEIAAAAGMPSRIFDTYFRYIDNLKVRYQVGKNIGAVYEDNCSIPQGCPFSMLMVALIFRPWILMMKQMNATPRVLADDLMFTTEGPQHRANTVRATKASIGYFTDMGAKVADNKCFTFASNHHTRIYLKVYDWDRKGMSIPNITDFRDLGSHFNINKTHNGATLTKRMRKATVMAKKLRWMKLSRARKEHIIRSNTLLATFMVSKRRI